LPEVVVWFFSYVICVCVIVWYMVSHSLVFGVHFLHSYLDFESSSLPHKALKKLKSLN